MVALLFLSFDNLIAGGYGVYAAFFGVGVGSPPLGFVFIRFGYVNANYDSYFAPAAYSGKLWNLVWKNVESSNSC